MSFLCHACGAAQGYLRSIQIGAVIQSPSTYQLAKYMKHTAPNPKYKVQSVFASTSTQAYMTYVLNAAAAGSVEIDQQNRVNIIWVAGSQVGFEYKGGHLVCPQDAIKVVLSTSTGKIHAYPQRSSQFQAQPCAHCGKVALC